MEMTPELITSLRERAQGTSKPDRFLGLAYTNPYSNLPDVETIKEYDGWRKAILYGEAIGGGLTKGAVGIDIRGKAAKEILPEWAESITETAGFIGGIGAMALIPVGGAGGIAARIAGRGATSIGKAVTAGELMTGIGARAAGKLGAGKVLTSAAAGATHLGGYEAFRQTADALYTGQLRPLERGGSILSAGTTGTAFGAVGGALPAKIMGNVKLYQILKKVVTGEQVAPEYLKDAATRILAMGSAGIGLNAAYQFAGTGTYQFNQDAITWGVLPLFMELMPRHQRSVENLLGKFKNNPGAVDVESRQVIEKMSREYDEVADLKEYERGIIGRYPVESIGEIGGRKRPIQVMEPERGVVQRTPKTVGQEYQELPPESRKIVTESEAKLMPSELLVNKVVLIEKTPEDVVNEQAIESLKTEKVEVPKVTKKSKRSEALPLEKAIEEAPEKPPEPAPKDKAPPPKQPTPQEAGEVTKGREKEISPDVSEQYEVKDLTDRASQDIDLTKNNTVSRAKYNKGDDISAINAAVRTKKTSPLYIYATNEGFVIEKNPPPFEQSHYVVHPSGRIESRVKMLPPSKPTPTEPVGKEPSYETKKGLMGRIRQEAELRGKKEYETDFSELSAATKEFHKNLAKDAINKALSEGKPVAPEVLADYPDLAKPKAVEEPAKPPEKPKTIEKVVESELTPYEGVVKFPIEQMKRDPYFQNRFEKFSKNTYDKIMKEGLDPAQVESGLMWAVQDKAGKETGEFQILKGFSRTKAAGDLGEKTFPMVIFRGTKEEAKLYSLKSNYQADQEVLVDNINAYKNMKELGVGAEELKLYFKDKTGVLEDLQHLSPEGRWIEEMARQKVKDEVKPTYPNLIQWARWVGEWRGKYPDRMTKAHENQLFKFVYEDPKAKNLFMLKADFFDLLQKNLGTIEFDQNKPLVLKRTGQVMTGDKAKKHLDKVLAELDDAKSMRANAKTTEEKTFQGERVLYLQGRLKELREAQGELPMFTEEGEPTGTEGKYTGVGAMIADQVALRKQMGWTEDQIINELAPELAEAIRGPKVYQVMKELGDKFSFNFMRPLVKQVKDPVARRAFARSLVMDEMASTNTGKAVEVLRQAGFQKLKKAEHTELGNLLREMDNRATEYLMQGMPYRQIFARVKAEFTIPDKYKSIRDKIEAGFRKARTEGKKSGLDIGFIPFYYPRMALNETSVQAIKDVGDMIKSLEELPEGYADRATVMAMVKKNQNVNNIVEHLIQRSTKYGVLKSGNKRATKSFNTRQEAEAWIAQHKENYTIVEVADPYSIVEKEQKDPLAVLKQIYNEGMQTIINPERSFEKKRSQAMPDWVWENRTDVIVPNYLEMAYKRAAESKTWGAKLQNLRALTKKIGSKKERDLVWKSQILWRGDWERFKRLSPSVEKLVDWYTAYELMSKIGLGTATIPNITQTLISTLPYYGVWNTLRSGIDLLNPSTRAFMRETGGSNILHHTAMDVIVGGRIPAGLMGKLSKMSLFGSGFEAINKVNYYLAANTTRLTLPKWIETAKGTSNRAIQMRARLKKVFGISMGNLPNQNTVKGKAAFNNLILEKSYRFATDSQLQRNVFSEPLFFNDPRTRPWMLFKRFGYRQFVFMKDMMVEETFARGNPMPLLRVVAGGLLGGEFVIWAKDKIKSYLSGEKIYRKDDPGTLERVLNDVTAVGTFGMFTDIFGGQDLGQSLKFAATPLPYSDFTRMMDAFTKVQGDWKKYGDGWFATKRNAYQFMPFAGMVPGYIGKRAMTDVQQQNRVEYFKTREKMAVMDLILDGEGSRASGRIAKWNRAYPQNPFMLHEFNGKAIREREKRKREMLLRAEGLIQ